MNNQIIVSVIVCTHNRSKLLETTLISLLQQDVDCTRYEIIIVDNASQDGTRDLISTYSKNTPAPKISYIYEGHLGTSWARNAGWQAARGSIIAYIDDDERAEQDWLSFLVKAMDENPMPVMAVGGAIRLDWDGQRPNWLPNSLERYYSSVEMGPNARILANGEYLLTSNLALHRIMFNELKGFRTDLGHVGNLESGGEDTELINRIRSSGGGIFYEPKAIVYHHIPKTRQRRRWIIARCYAAGLSQPILDDLNSIKVKDILYNLRLAISNLLFALYFLLRKQDSVFVERSSMSAIRLGRAVGLIHILLK
jgi:glycosyltransferase involved in cell wall biosynthesis